MATTTKGRIIYVHEYIPSPSSSSEEDEPTHFSIRWVAAESEEDTYQSLPDYEQLLKLVPQNTAKARKNAVKNYE